MAWNHMGKEKGESPFAKATDRRRREVKSL